MSKESKSEQPNPEKWVSRFGMAPSLPPDERWSERWWEADDKQIESLAKGTLRIRDPSTGDVCAPDRVWLISRTTLAVEEAEVLIGCKPAHELVGGWVTRAEALLQFPQPEEVPSAHVELAEAA